MNTKTAVTKMKNLCPHLVDIVKNFKENDELLAVMNRLRESRKKDGKPVDNVIFLLEILPLLLEKSDAAIYNVIAIMLDKDVKEVEEQSFGTTWNDIQTLLQDEDLKHFFMSAIGKKSLDTPVEES